MRMMHAALTSVLAATTLLGLETQQTSQAQQQQDGSAGRSQTVAPPQAQTKSQEPKELTVAPNAPKQTQEATSTNPGQAQPSGGVANICTALIAYVQQRDAKAAEEAAKKAAAGTGVSCPAASPPSDNQETQQAAPQATQQKTAVNAPSPNSVNQEKPASPGQTAPAVDRTQQTSGQTAPIPNDGARQAMSLSLEQAQVLAKTNDPRQCQKTAQGMRRAGVSLPAGLIALAALRDDLLMQGSTTPTTPATGQQAQ